MRIIHTSDWHLGQHFMGKSRQAEHQAFLDWLLQQVAVQQADAVLVAGDIFDTGAPPSYARELYNRLVVALHELGVQLILLAGNHDSVATLAESQPLLARLNTLVVPAIDAEPARMVHLLRNKQGQPGALLCALPFIRPRDVMRSEAGQSAEDKQRSLQQAIASYYQQVYDAACAKRTAQGLPLPIIATGHLTTVGASSSEAVREIYVGALEAFPTAAFPPADYIALGHIHRPQRVGGLDHIRYSGSPIALGFDESRQQKEVLLVELDGGGVQHISPLPVPVFQPMAQLRGTLASLGPQLAAAAQAGSSTQPVWLEVCVQADDYLADLQHRLAQLCDGLPLDILRLRRERPQQAASLAGNPRETLDELSPQEVFARRLALETLDEGLATELATRHQHILQQLQAGQA